MSNRTKRHYFGSKRYEVEQAVLAGVASTSMMTAFSVSIR
jgi:hypothetical protein